MLLKLENLRNTRDLGGLPSSDGRYIKRGQMYRSGLLKDASKNDIATLTSLNITKIVDFRADKEAMEQADPKIGNAQYLHIRAEEKSAVGIVRDEDANKSFSQMLIERVLDDNSYAINYMRDLYKTFITSDFTTGQYRKFLDVVLNNDSGATLWHCTAGKDRAGFGAILVEEILGVPRSIIKECYLKTNEYTKNEVEFLVESFRPLAPDNYPEAQVRLFYRAEEEYFDSIYDEANLRYGSFDNFLTEVMQIDDEKRKAFKDKFLTWEEA